MSHEIPTSVEQLVFLRNLQRLLADGSFVASYKFALLNALADLAVRKGSDTREALQLSTYEIAEEFIGLYWRQVAPFPGSPKEPKVLKQNSGSEAVIVRLIREAKQAGNTLTLAEARRNTHSWHSLVKSVEKVVKVQPLWKLQTIGTMRLDFMYDNVDSGSCVTLKPGVAFCLRAFYSLILQLVRSSWMDFVRQLNTQDVGDSADLAGFLFGTERTDLSRHAVILRDYQADQCFYCDGGLKGTGEVDHFVPWSRYPVDFGHNFVLAHSTCNGNKSNFLACNEHLARWCERNLRHGQQLAADFDEARIAHDIQFSVHITSWAYAQAESVGSQLWVARNTDLVPFNADWRTLVGQFG